MDGAEEAHRLVRDAVGCHENDRLPPRCGQAWRGLRDEGCDTLHRLRERRIAGGRALEQRTQLSKGPTRSRLSDVRTLLRAERQVLPAEPRVEQVEVDAGVEGDRQLSHLKQVIGELRPTRRRTRLQDSSVGGAKGADPVTGQHRARIVDDHKVGRARSEALLQRLCETGRKAIHCVCGGATIRAAPSPFEGGSGQRHRRSRRRAHRVRGGLGPFEKQGRVPDATPIWAAVASMLRVW